MYGYNSFPFANKIINYEPICKLKTKITYLKDINAGESISYGRKFISNKKMKIDSLLEEKSEARIFEIISYSILKNHYKNQHIFIGTSMNDIKEESLNLYKTGRTNANDGGIDFVMKPLGRFFQVTEVDKYLSYLSTLYCS